MGYCLSTFPLKSRCCHQLALHFTPKYSWHTGAHELKYSWVLLHGRQWSKKYFKTTQSWGFLGETFTVLQPVGQFRLHGVCGVCGQALVDRIKGGMQVGQKPGGAAGRRERPAAEAPAPSIEGRMLGHMQLPGDGVTSRS